LERNLSKLSAENFELLIIGGGIQGASIAWLASLSGIKTALVEKGDYAEGNSSNNQKIIHGGIRYLQSLNINRINESIYSRNLLLTIAPENVKIQECIIPIYKKKLMNKYFLKGGIGFYNYLQKKNRIKVEIPKATVINSTEVKKYIPHIKEEEIAGGIKWYDGVCRSTERLVLSLIKSAVKNGACSANYIEAESIIFKNKKIKGISATDTLTGKKYCINSKKIINCTGLPLDKTKLTDKQIYKGNNIKLIAGINIIVDKILPHNSAVGIRSISKNNSGYYFILPWNNKSIIGTEWFLTDCSEPSAEFKQMMIDSLLNNFNESSDIKIKKENIRFIHVGFVPGKNDGNKIKLITDSIFYEHNNKSNLEGLYTVVGVKYTTALVTAEKTIKHLFNKKISVNSLISNYQNDDEDIMPAKILDLPYLFSQNKNILSLSNREQWKQLIRFFIKNESVFKLSDLIMRRTSLGSSSFPTDDVLNFISEIMKEQLDWSEEERLTEITSLKEKYFQVYN
jgi:glycerol-3-phosphate dehydrogenase